jgi:hypothetical protein
VLFFSLDIVSLFFMLMTAKGDKAWRQGGRRVVGGESYRERKEGFLSWCYSKKKTWKDRRQKK